MMFKRLLPLVAAGVAVWQLDRLRRERRLARHRAAAPVATPPAEVRWEGEGGALPDTGAQTGPEPRAAA